MTIKLNAEEAIRSIELGKKSAIDIYNSNKRYSDFYLEEMIKESRSNLMKVKIKSINQIADELSKIFRIISVEDRIKLAMESRIEDINKYKYLIKLYEEELIRRMEFK